MLKTSWSRKRCLSTTTPSPWPMYMQSKTKSARKHKASWLTDYRQRTKMLENWNKSRRSPTGNRHGLTCLRQDVLPGRLSPPSTGEFSIKTEPPICESTSATHGEDLTDGNGTVTWKAKEQDRRRFTKSTLPTKASLTRQKKILIYHCREGLPQTMLCIA